MVPVESLPVVLVSAGLEADAAAFITELIDDDVTQEVEGAAAMAGAGVGGARVWRLLNKYYRALVRVRPYVCASGTPTSPAPAPAPASAPAPPCEALVVYLASHECTVEALSRRVRECGAAAGEGGAGGAAVRLVVCDAAAAPPALARAAAALRAELVPLREEPEPAEGEAEAEGEDEGRPFREEWGVGRARAALHAHAWRGLERLDRDAPAAPAPNLGELELGDSSSENEHLSDEEEEDEESMLRRAERFATLLDALPAARRGAGAGAGAAENGTWEGERDERLRRAEALVGAFCRALGPQ